MGLTQFGVTDGYIELWHQTITQTITLKESGQTVRFHFEGNGTDNYFVDSSSVQQGALSVPVTCNSHSGFYVPSFGRWSDTIALNGFVAGAASFVSLVKLSVPMIVPIYGGTGEPGTIGIIDTPLADGEATAENPVSPLGNDGVEWSTEPKGQLHDKLWSSVAISNNGETIIGARDVHQIYDEETWELLDEHGGGVYISIDKGITWADITPPGCNCYDPHVCCDSTGQKICLVTSMDDRSRISEYGFVAPAKYDGCILISNNGGASWTAHFPGFGRHPGIYGPYTWATASLANEDPEVLFGSFYDPDLSYEFGWYGYDQGDGSLSGYDTYILNTSSGAWERASSADSHGPNDLVYGLYQCPRKKYSDCSMSSDGSTIVVCDDFLYKSSDSGVTWTALHPSTDMTYKGNTDVLGYGSWAKIRVSANAQKMVSYERDNSYLYFSDNGGTTFTKVYTGKNQTCYPTISGDGNIIYYVNIRDGSVYKSMDGLVSTSEITNLPGGRGYHKLETDYDGTSVIIEYYPDDDQGNGGVVVSKDAGATWHDVTPDGTTGVFTVAVSGDGETFAAGQDSYYAPTYDNIFVYYHSLIPTNPRYGDPPIVVVNNYGIITVSDNTNVLNGDTITINDITYTFSKLPTMAVNEILIGGTAALTASNIAAVLSATYGALITATALSNAVSVVYLNENEILWNTTSTGITLNPTDKLTQDIEYFGGTVGLVPMYDITAVSTERGESGDYYGYVELPALTGAASTTTDTGVHSRVPSMTSSGFAYYCAGGYPLTDPLKIALLHYDDTWFENICGMLFTSTEDDDLALEITQFVALNISYASDLINHGVVEYWADPRTSLIKGSGDCEDFAFLLGCLMLNSGILPTRVRVYMGKYNNLGHAWVAYQRTSDNEWIILDATKG